MIHDFYNHYIRTEADGRIIKGFSDAFEQPQEGDICINEQGGYQFRLKPDGEENPTLYNDNGVPIYKWDDDAIVQRTLDEITKDTPEPEPDPIAQLRAEYDAAFLELVEMIIGGEM